MCYCRHMHCFREPVIILLDAPTWSPCWNSHMDSALELPHGLHAGAPTWSLWWSSTWSPTGTPQGKNKNVCVHSSNSISDLRNIWLTQESTGCNPYLNRGASVLIYAYWNRIRKSGTHGRQLLGVVREYWQERARVSEGRQSRRGIWRHWVDWDEDDGLHSLLPPHQINRFPSFLF